MKIEITGGRIVTIDWKYIRRVTTDFRLLPPRKDVVFNVPLYAKIATPKTKGGTTVCILSLVIGNTSHIISRTSVCSKKDNYCKAIGRKHSLKKAIELFEAAKESTDSDYFGVDWNKWSLSKEDREIIWSFVKY